ncbi:coiled-coil domain-containing protein 18-like, partial [Ruditapes philippinarum]|uniref:coiled-coil domain-containing protein 18-like n=1 Tax=Ruditapes philippinarum TaxID=129788 RepID=UPI00295BCE97
MDGKLKEKDDIIKEKIRDMNSLIDYCIDLDKEKDKLKEEMKKLEKESHQKIMEAQQQKKAEVKEQKIITRELNKYARYLESKTESLKRKSCRNDLQIEGLQKENDRLYKKLELDAYFFDKKIKIKKRKIAFLNDIYLREVDQKNQLKTEKENLVRIIRGQDCQRKEVERLKKEIKCLEQQLEPVAVSACMEMGYSHEEVTRALHFLHERQGCTALSECLMRILMEMEEEEEPQGAVGGQ